MQIVNAELALRILAQPGASVKFLLGDPAMVFFPTSQQHRDVKTHGLSYEDGYRGNAAAGLLSAGKVEIRFHSAYSETRIRTIWGRVRAAPEFAGVDLGRLFYHGRELV
jgi:hypothetical protein